MIPRGFCATLSLVSLALFSASGVQAQNVENDIVYPSADGIRIINQSVWSNNLLNGSEYYAPPERDRFVVKLKHKHHSYSTDNDNDTVFGKTLQVGPGMGAILY
jgi:hypothetical protein